MKPAPHYLLLTGSSQNDPSSVAQLPIGDAPTRSGGRWHFVLEPIHHGPRIEADEPEPGVVGERLNLLAVVRGVEALEEPANVTLITPSRFVGRGIRSGIASWRAKDWHWERFGEMKPVKHADLWRRIDHAMQFHKIDCRIWDFNRSRSNDPLTQSIKQLTSGRPLMKNRSRLHNPLGDGGFEPLEKRHSRPQGNRRRIVLTQDRMNDHLADLEDIEALEARHRKLFRATSKGWTRVTEIGEDAPSEDLLPRAFGCSAN